MQIIQTDFTRDSPRTNKLIVKACMWLAARLPYVYRSKLASTLVLADPMTPDEAAFVIIPSRRIQMTVGNWPTIEFGAGQHIFVNIYTDPLEMQFSNPKDAGPAQNADVIDLNSRRPK